MTNKYHIQQLKNKYDRLLWGIKFILVHLLLYVKYKIQYHTWQLEYHYEPFKLIIFLSDTYKLWHIYNTDYRYLCDKIYSNMSAMLQYY